MKINTAIKAPPQRTHEGAVAAKISPLQELRRSVMSCFLWEDEFYESGESISDRIIGLVAKVPAPAVVELAVEARQSGHLRHVPLLLLCALAKNRVGGRVLSDAIPRVISRPDELCEILAIHAKINDVTPATMKKSIPAAMKRGIAAAFLKFNEYSLAKYDRDGAIKLRDVMMLTHPKPDTPERAEMWKRVLKRELATPDTWEVSLSGGADKKATFERLIREGKLGYLALLRNLRNMSQAGCDRALVTEAITARKNGADKVLPFRFTAAARAAPEFEAALDQALLTTIKELPVLSGTTAVLVDVSDSMNTRLSGKSDMTRLDAAATLSSIINGDVRVFSFSNHLVEVPARRGFAGVDAVIRSQHHGGTQLIGAVAKVVSGFEFDRIIVISDEQAATDRYALRVPDCPAYMINVASARNGIGYGRWVHLDGFSENVIRFIAEHEAAEA